eukprot:CAMPEP_0119134430 /NCGR_PEP_ID=MMETSP1310-20130426/16857_1 /TAXON_ID=464262 /ORGANISM="Genus nov. species nov., Strain RCC2339" /LENGTH=37 /DNA_ID= /DNA_START= /DNA_END= /DNA_ORIENTATION=
MGSPLVAIRAYVTTSSDMFDSRISDFISVTVLRLGRR